MTDGRPTQLAFVLNGRFLQRPVTGVERLALELTSALQVLASETASFDVAVPRGTLVDPERQTLDGLPELQVHVVGRLGGHRWEQAELAGYRPDAWLLNLCNTAPMTRRRQVVIICDAQFILHPESYARAFRWWYRVMLSVVGRRSAAVFTISEFSRTQLERYRVVPPGKVRVLRLGADHLETVFPDPATLQRHGLVERPYIFAIGSLARHKNLALLIEAFTTAQLPGIDLVVAGGGNARVFASAGLTAANNVRFLGRVTDAELRTLYANAKAFACPSVSEGFGFTPLEAMAAGCPVIATIGGAVPEVCGDAAVYADPYDVAQWREALAKVATNAELRTELAGKGLARAATFRWRDAAEQVLAVVSDLDAAGVKQQS